ncbi:DUF6737 family protein [Lyngbya aestuarii]|uniref:DUF6737 family protein n=1 Tax=Lyngbya aestuarii TaxID=118322 RepID=UPI00403DB5DB
MSTRNSLSPWSYKPWWCQPWSILLTGIIIIASSWMLLDPLWLRILVSCPILVWWFYFLLLWPELMRRSGGLIGDDQSPEEATPQVRKSELN